MMVKNLEFKEKSGDEPKNNPKRQKLVRLKEKGRKGKECRERTCDQESE